MSVVLGGLAFTLALEIAGAVFGMWLFRDRGARAVVPARPRSARATASLCPA